MAKLKITPSVCRHSLAVNARVNIGQDTWIALKDVFNLEGHAVCMVEIGEGNVVSENISISKDDWTDVFNNYTVGVESTDIDSKLAPRCNFIVTRGRLAPQNASVGCVETIQ